MFSVDFEGFLDVNTMLLPIMFKKVENRSIISSTLQHPHYVEGGHRMITVTQDQVGNEGAGAGVATGDAVVHQTVCLSSFLILR